MADSKVMYILELCVGKSINAIAAYHSEVAFSAYQVGSHFSWISEGGVLIERRIKGIKHTIWVENGKPIQKVVLMLG
jgi:hypothetical protein